MMPWITGTSMLKSRLMKIEIYHMQEMLCIKYCTLSDLTPESYQETLLKIAQHCMVEHYIIKKYLRGRKKNSQVSMPSVIIKEYQKHQIISLVSSNEERNHTSNNSLLRAFKRLRQAAKEINLRSTGTQHSGRQKHNSKVNTCITFRGDTLIEFKGCAVSAVNGYTLKVTSGEPTELLFSPEYEVVSKDDGVYEFALKKSCGDKEQGSRLNYVPYKRESPSKYGDISKGEVSDYLCVKPLLNGNKRKIITANVDRKRQTESDTKKGAKTSANNRTASSQSIRSRLDEINRIKIQGYFVNKLYE
eukprot:TRINITY_DN4351_c0_g4_i1.p1 TRINITY_DN4351_c0_g4~~TRINITY_DN4351_c0_g4_i1.p1  ORF type:complete len:303 (+),score=61.87 TRINITY_DN4351_c0_g4_i1:715-1623(+)